ncbi:hypothetical protein JTB14_019352 [Gonioctena quinquepunctata]|nr:hypothetical protein JTB14_019352 [Gonioctena quinquepunctata]
MKQDFESSSEKTKRRRVQHLETTCLEELSLATEMELRQSGKKDSAAIVYELCRFPLRRGNGLKEGRKRLGIPRQSGLPNDQVLALMIDANLSTYQYDIIRKKTEEINKVEGKIPAKELCYPNEMNNLGKTRSSDCRRAEISKPHVCIVSFPDDVRGGKLHHRRACSTGWREPSDGSSYAAKSTNWSTREHSQWSKRLWRLWKTGLNALPQFREGAVSLEVLKAEDSGKSTDWSSNLGDENKRPRIRQRPPWRGSLLHSETTTEKTQEGRPTPRSKIVGGGLFTSDKRRGIIQFEPW